ncbi:MAG: hypothetical protein EXS06_00360 [Planctomycetaceae bacterium]|nr:hypothetical protein [Planctomycetaceae bacterium]
MSSPVRPWCHRPLLPLARMAAWAGRRGAATILAGLVGGGLLPLLAPSAAANEAPAAPSRGAGVSDETAATFQKRNGEVFQGWSKPKAVLVFTGELDGYIEPCGCTGKENQKGGLSRRRNFLGALAAAEWPVVALDLGDQVNRFGRQTEIKFGSIVDGLKAMQYAAVGFGPKDLRLPAEEVVAAVSAVGDKPTPFVCANVGLIGFDSGITPLHRVVEAGGLKIGITAVLGDAELAEIRNDLIATKPAAEALVEPAAALARAGCDHQVLLAFATPEETKKLAARYPQFDFVVTAGGAEEPPAQPEKLPSHRAAGKPPVDRHLLELGHKGMFAVVIGLFDDAAQPIRSQRVPLDARWGEAEEMIRLLAGYQAQLETLGLTGLGLTPGRHPTGRRFAGSASCAECHTSSFEVWTNSGHAEALTTLETQTPRRDGDPECLSCHVVGWDPQKFQPYEGGFMGVKATPQLAHQGCENCHGPAAAHASAERGQVRVPAADRERLRAELHLALDTPQAKQQVMNNCLECHDLDNSPQFDFDTYWPQVEHGEEPGAAAAAAALE